MCVLVFIQNYSIFCGGIYYFYMQNFVIMQKKNPKKPVFYMGN